MVTLGILNQVLLLRETLFQICDLGISQLSKSIASKTSCISKKGRQGTTSHIAPEIWENGGRESDFPEDVYSFAITMWEVFTQLQPYCMKCSLFMLDLKL